MEISKIKHHILVGGVLLKAVICKECIENPSSPQGSFCEKHWKQLQNLTKKYRNENKNNK